MLVLHILCHNLVGYESSRELGTKITECGYETSKPGYESSGYEKSMGTKRLVCPRGSAKSFPELKNSPLPRGKKKYKCYTITLGSLGFPWGSPGGRPRGKQMVSV